MQVLGPIEDKHHAPQQRICDECLEPKDPVIALNIVLLSKEIDEHDRPVWCVNCLRAAVELLDGQEQQRTITPLCWFCKESITEDDPGRRVGNEWEHLRNCDAFDSLAKE